MCQCEYTKLHHRGGFVRCTAKATTSVWCPTWVSADEGPMSVCDEHAKGFMPEHNEHIKVDTFLWGRQAQEAYEAAYPREQRHRRVVSAPNENPLDPAEKPDFIFITG